MPALYTNQATSTLLGAISSTDTVFIVQSNHGARFPTIEAGSGDYFFLTLDDNAGNVEIVKCGTRAGDQMQVERAQDGTTAKAFPAGATVEIRVTRALLNALKAEATPQPVSFATQVTSQTSVVFAGIPNWATEVSLWSENMTRSTQSAQFHMRLGTLSQIDTNTTYYAQAIYQAGQPLYGYPWLFENRFRLASSGTVSSNLRPMFQLSLAHKSQNLWLYTGGAMPQATGTDFNFGAKALSGALQKFELFITTGTYSGLFHWSYR